MIIILAKMEFAGYMIAMEVQSLKTRQADSTLFYVSTVTILSKVGLDTGV